MTDILPISAGNTWQPVPWRYSGGNYGRVWTIRDDWERTMSDRRHSWLMILTVTGCLGLASHRLNAAESAVPATWPQWRGPSRDATIEADRWPTSLQGDALQTIWRVQLGPSYSGPIVAADRVFVTETRDEKYEVVRALSRATGEQLWTAEWEGAMDVPFFARSNGDWIRSTPAYDGERLYVGGMRDVLVCLDAETGQEQWRLDFVQQLNSKLPDFGFVSSPLVVGEHLYVQAGGGFVKLNKRTGEVVWQTLSDGGGMYGSAFSSPTLATIAGGEQLLVQTRSKLAGVNPASGEVLWSQEIPAFRGMNILTPTVHQDNVLTSSYGGRTFLFKVSKGGDGFDLSEAWTNKAQAYMSSPVVIDGHAYLHLRNRRFTCVELATGESKWTTTPFGEYWSMVANGKQILALDERGVLRLIRANPAEFELLDERKVSDISWAHLAVCDDEVFVRELNGLTVYRWRDVETASK